MRRRFSFLVIATIALVATACTSGFFYNRLDTLSYWYLTNQVTLDDTQSKELRDSLREFLAWHRVSELPQYADFLDQLSREAAAAPLTRARIEDARVELETLWQKFVDAAAPYAARSLSGLTPDQRDELFVSLAEDDDDAREKYCSGDREKVRKRREKTFVKNIEAWTGRLSGEQKAMVAAGVGRLSPDSCSRVDSQIESRNALRVLLDTYSSSPEFEKRLARFLTHPEEHWTPDYRRDFDANRNVIVDTLATVEATLTPQQRQKSATELGDLAEELRKLASQGTVTQPSAG